MRLATLVILAPIISFEYKRCGIIMRQHTCRGTLFRSIFGFDLKRGKPSFRRKRGKTIYLDGSCHTGPADQILHLNSGPGARGKFIKPAAHDLLCQVAPDENAWGGAGKTGDALGE